MSAIRRDLVANIASKGWAVLISLLLLPVYIHFLGMEAYGLIGVFISISGIVSLFDFGLGTTVNRELARMSSNSQLEQQMRDLVRTLEVVYWSTGIVIGIVVAALAPVIATQWINPEQLPPETVQRSLLLMGLALACQWPVTLYTAGLFGLHRQVLQNTLSAAMTTVRSLGAALVLWQVSASIEAFLLWQISWSVVETLINAVVLWRSMPQGSGSARFNPRLMQGLWQFAAGVTGISVMSVILTQLDKVILSGLLSLEAFGYYMLASRLSGGLYYLVGPVIATFFPRFSQLLESKNENELRRVYHQACQIMSFLIFPPAVMLIFFSYEILHLWTRNPVIADHGYAVLSLLAAGTALNALASPPHVLQLASGWTRLALINSTVTTVLLAPLIYVMTGRYGGVGAASVWLVLNVGNVLVNAIFTHRRLLKHELGSWFRIDVGPPLLAAVVVGAAWKWLLPAPAAFPWSALNLVLVSFATLAVAAVATPEIRRVAARSLTRNYGF